MASAMKDSNPNEGSKGGGMKNDDGRLKGDAKACDAKFKEGANPNESVPTIGHQKGAE